MYNAMVTRCGKAMFVSFFFPSSFCNSKQLRTEVVHRKGFNLLGFLFIVTRLGKKNLDAIKKRGKKKISLNMTDDAKINDNILNGQEDQDFFPWRIFINHVDTYHGKKLTSVSLILYRIKRYLDIQISFCTYILKFITREI